MVCTPHGCHILDDEMVLSDGKSDVVLVLQLALIWASFLSILPLLMA